jgi:hypothetical protein
MFKKYINKFKMLKAMGEVKFYNENDLILYENRIANAQNGIRYPTMLTYKHILNFSFPLTLP